MTCDRTELPPALWIVNRTITVLRPFGLVVVRQPVRLYVFCRPSRVWFLFVFLYISYFFLFNQIVIEYAVYRFLNSLILFFSVVLSSVCPCAISLRVCNVLSARHIWTAPAAVNVATMVFGSGNKFRIKRYASHLSDSTFLFFSG